MTLKFTRREQGGLRANGETYSYIIRKADEGKGHVLYVYEQDRSISGLILLDGDWVDRAFASHADLKDIARRHEALAPGFRPCDHGGKSLMPTAIDANYNAWLAAQQS